MNFLTDLKEEEELKLPEVYIVKLKLMSPKTRKKYLEHGDHDIIRRINITRHEKNSDQKDIL